MCLVTRHRCIELLDLASRHLGSQTRLKFVTGKAAKYRAIDVVERVHAIDKLHCAHALINGAKKLFIRTVDTDVVVIIIGVFHKLIEIQATADICVGFGTGKDYSYYHVNSICAALGGDVSKALPAIHAFSGCDTTSAFSWKGKPKVWSTLEVFPEVTAAFEELLENPFQHFDNKSVIFKSIERFTILMYDKMSPLNSVNEMRKSLYCDTQRAMDRLPPTENALFQHLLRVVYQVGIWASSLQADPLIPSPANFG